MRKTFLCLDSLLDAVEVLFILKIAFFDFVKGVFFGFVTIKGCLFEKIGDRLHLLEESKAVLQIVHLKFDKIVNQDFVKIV